MRTLELRLEDVGYGWQAEAATAYIASATVPDCSGPEEAARAFAALAFFDRALLAPLTDGCSAGACFEKAAGLTLLRFGVRIIGLEEESHG